MGQFVVWLCVMLWMVASSILVHAQDTNCGLDSRFEAGMVGRVLPGDANRLRAEPNRNASQITTLPGEHYFHVLDGVACADGFTWRQVEFSDGTQMVQGWTVEANATEYWLENVPYDGFAVSYDGVSFVVSETLGDNVTVQFTPAERSTDDTRVRFPAELVFALIGEYPDPDYDEKFDFPSISIYRTDAYDDGYERDADYIPNMFEGTFQDTVETLANVLDERPELSDYNVTSNRLPDLAPNVAHGTLAYRDYLDFQSGSGYRFITFYEQAFFYAQNETLLYRFNGITELGSYLVVIEMPVNPPALPAPFELSSTANDADNGFARYQTYVDGVDTFFDAIPSEQWLPNLDMLDALVDSLVINEITELDTENN